MSYFGNSSNPDAAPGADPDFDGVVNLLEFFLGGIPIGADASNTSILPTCSKSATSLVFQFRRSKTASQEFSTVVETTSALLQNNWVPVASENIVVQSIDTFTDLITATIPLVPSADSSFVRLKVQTIP